MPFRSLALPVLFLGVQAAAGTLPLRAAESWKVDGVHSSLIFKVKHLGVSNFYGRFNQLSGTVATADGALTGVEIEVKADSVDTANQKRDAHVKSPDFLNVKQFPTISFKGKEVKKGEDDSYVVKGDLTLHGVTKEVEAQVQRTGTGKGPDGKELIGFETTFTIKRTDHGMKFMVGPLADDIHITVSVEAVRA